ncbi:alpha/beta fold hydrolase [Planosporangium sp. 12N6]|uniref:alpha/beta fold hydrolase n=1 Tax=Planosporangium spinosum TaxID=3402278 RepID=UPI003CEDE2E1
MIFIVTTSVTTLDQVRRLSASPDRSPGELPTDIFPAPLQPGQDRSRGTVHEPSDAHVEWMTLVARHSRSSGAPSPLPLAMVERWRDVPCAVIVGEQDCFLPTARLRAAFREKLGVGLGVVTDAGHLTTEECPEYLAEVIDATALLR